MQYTFEYFGPNDSRPREFKTEQISLAAAWREFWKQNPNAEQVQCFEDGFGWIADQSSYPKKNFLI